MRVIKEAAIVEDSWQLSVDIEADASIPAGDVIIPFSLWQLRQQEITEREGKIGILIDGDIEVEDVVPFLEHFALIAINFVAFKDGRGYSQARLLRDQYAYEGDIRAVGDVLRDQLYYMQRCGFTSYDLRKDKNPEEALKGFKDFSVKYQTAADGAVPVYRQR